MPWHLHTVLELSRGSVCWDSGSWPDFACEPCLLPRKTWLKNLKPVLTWKSVCSNSHAGALASAPSWKCLCNLPASSYATFLSSSEVSFFNKQDCWWLWLALTCYKSVWLVSVKAAVACLPGRLLWSWAGCFSIYSVRTTRAWFSHLLFHPSLILAGQPLRKVDAGSQVVRPAWPVNSSQRLTSPCLRVKFMSAQCDMFLYTRAAHS